jgi:3'-phosphoadenosine 5'-phosphosulfate sulfotransferase (PAPS reductase)/FAD synthetase
MKQIFIINALFFLCFDIYSQSKNLIGTSWKLTKEVEYVYSDTLFNHEEFIHFIDNKKMAYSNTRTLDSLDYLYNYKIKKRIFSKYNLLIFSNIKEGSKANKKWDYTKGRAWSCRIKMVESTNLILAFPDYEDSWMKFYEKIK